MPDPRYPPSRLRGLHRGDPTTGAAPVADGEVTRVVRVRGPAEAVDAFAALSAAERGALVAQVMAEPVTAPSGTGGTASPRARTTPGTARTG